MARGKLLDPIHPGEILREEFMKSLGVSINGLARDIAVPPGRISAIVNGKRAITADTALRLDKYFGVSSELWLGLQADFDLRAPSERSDQRSNGGSAPGSPDRCVFAYRLIAGYQPRDVERGVLYGVVCADG